ncbi:helix-hairpin-helix domain-containing protein [Clostridiaceae bacterium HSG29]|nr:helix-hairpin-helix domain-containing protein [Clostridiaceae bacterium HSG29]
MKIKIKSKDTVILLVLVILVILTKIGIVYKQNNMNINISKKEVVMQIDTPIIYKVHIDGEVNNPGVYDVNSDDRLDNLIEIAGGLTENADSTRINLARLLEDGLKIYIPSKEESINININNNKLTLTDFNQLTEDELTKIDGIGEVIALRIIDYRNENGSFNKITDLLNVNGIGEKKLSQIKNIIY